ncbi:hypothetical protein JCM10213v2_006453 [Rhodosporidiobolus nylandii]
MRKSADISEERAKVVAANEATSEVSTKRQKTSALPALTLEGSLSEELLVRCLSFLTAHDLAVVSRVSSAWHRLAQDPDLWKSLYLRTYASAAIRRQAHSGAHIPRTRPWRELFKISSNWRSGTARTSVLGRGIRKAVLAEAPPEVTLRTALFEEGTDGEGTAAPPEQQPETLLQLFHQFIFTASRTPSSPSTTPPSVTVHQSLPSGGSALIGTFSSTRLTDFFSSRPSFRPPLSITELRLDDAPSPSSAPVIALFYSTGQFSLFRLALPSASAPSLSFSADEVFFSAALGSPISYPLAAHRSMPFDPVLHARLHGQILVTCSESLTMRFWRVSETSSGDVEVEEADTPLRTSEKSWKPAVLSLGKVGGELAEVGHASSRRGSFGAVEEEQCFRATLAYSTPVFPSSWTVGLQEFLIAVTPARHTAFSLSSSPPRTHLSVSYRNATASPVFHPLPSTPRRSSPFSPPTASPADQSPFTSIEHSHPWIVASRRDNQLDVFEVSSSSPPPLSPARLATPASSRMRLDLSTPRIPPAPQLVVEHRRTLFGHTARVAGVALMDDAGAASAGGTALGAMRCVSAGDDGAVKVWELTPTPARGGGAGGVQRRRHSHEAVVDVQALPTAASAPEDGGETAWQRMKRRRTAGVHGKDDEPTPRDGQCDRPERIRRVLVDEDKIVLVGAGAAGGEESVRVLRFD